MRSQGGGGRGEAYTLSPRILHHPSCFPFFYITRADRDITSLELYRGSLSSRENVYAYTSFSFTLSFPHVNQKGSSKEANKRYKSTTPIVVRSERSTIPQKARPPLPPLFYSQEYSSNSNPGSETPQKMRGFLFAPVFRYLPPPPLPSPFNHNSATFHLNSLL